MFFTSAASGDLRPSFFEMYAQDKLVSSLRPAVKFAVEVLAVRQPWLFRVIPFADELFLAIHLVLEASSLSKAKATLSEAFYALRRDRSSTGFRPPEGLSALGRRDMATTLLFVALVPYLKSKCDATYERLSGGSAAQLLGASRETGAMARGSEGARRWHALFLRFYPWLSSAHDLAHFVYNLLYLFEKTPFFSPFLRLQRLVVRRQSTQEMQLSPAPQASGGALGGRLGGVLSGVLSGLRIGLLVAVFMFKAIEYFYRVENQTTRQSTPLLRPPAPLEPAAAPDAALPAQKNVCSICRFVRTNPAACAASGYVFCYRCIFEHIERRQHCPVTLLPASISDIRRVYESA